MSARTWTLLATVLVRGADLVASMSQYLVQRLQETPNITVRTRSTPSGSAARGSYGSARALMAMV